MANELTLSAADRRTAHQQAKKIAQEYSRAPSFILEVGERFNTDTGKTEDTSINIRKLSSDEDWNDTDLYQTLPFEKVKVIPLADDGTAIVDLYIYERNREDKFDHGDLVCNMQLELDGDGLKAIHVDSKKNVWRKEAA